MFARDSGSKTAHQLADSSAAAQASARLLRTALLRDLALYLVCFAFALGTALASEFYGYRIWGNFATAGYGLAVGHTCWLITQTRAGRTCQDWLSSRWLSIALVGALAMVVPLAVLVVRRLTGVDWQITPNSWSAQPEVWVIERSATLLLRHGTPYVDVTALGRPAVINDYTPYGPAMSAFGLPRALLGGGPVANAFTDARLLFALCACLGVLVALRLLHWPRIPITAAQLAVAFPLTALTWAVAGPDLAVVGLLILAFALAATGRVVSSAIVLGVVISAKLIVAPAAIVLGLFVLCRRDRDCPARAECTGGGAFAKFLVTLMAASAALNLPALLSDPRAFAEHVIRFPAGLGMVASPAASPLPGYLISGIGWAGKTAAFVLLGVAAISMGAWLLRRPPRLCSDALLRTAVGLGAFTLLTPATRYGYLLYPAVLFGAMLIFREAEQDSERAASSTPIATFS